MDYKQFEQVVQSGKVSGDLLRQGIVPAAITAFGQGVDKQPRRMVGKVIECVFGTVEAATMKNLPEGILFKRVAGCAGQLRLFGMVVLFHKMRGTITTSR